MRYKWRIIIIILILVAVIYYITVNASSKSSDTGKLEVFNTNISQELKNIPNNTVIYLALKDSFILPENYKIDSQVIDRSILVYPADNKNINYKGIGSLESFGGIYLTSANTVTNDDMFKEINNTKFNLFKEANLDSDATSETVDDGKGNKKFVITQNTPFKMIETILNRGLIIEVVGSEESSAYKQIVDTYSDSELISNNDHKAIYQLQRDLVIGYESREAQKVFALLSTEAQKQNSLEAIKEGMTENIFQDMISIEPIALLCINQNYILQSRVLFDGNYMKRVNITFKVEYDGERNNWSIESYSISDKEKHLSIAETE